MKNIFFSALICLLFFSCSKEQLEQNSIQQIDNIQISDKNGNIINEYKYDVLNQEYIGDQPTEKAIHIKGEVIDKYTNSTGGQTVFCVVSESTCYSN